MKWFMNWTKWIRDWAEEVRNDFVYGENYTGMPHVVVGLVISLPFHVSAVMGGNMWASACGSLLAAGFYWGREAHSAAVRVRKHPPFSSVRDALEELWFTNWDRKNHNDFWSVVFFQCLFMIFVHALKGES